MASALRDKEAVIIKSSLSMMMMMMMMMMLMGYVGLCGC
jgi:hypothetical protein